MSKTKKIIILFVILTIIIFFFFIFQIKNIISLNSAKLCEKAIFLMEKGNFDEAIKYLEKSLKFDWHFVKAHYAIAVAYLRKEPPDINKALAHRNTAEKLGYVIPEWFDNYIKVTKKSRNPQ